MPALPATDQGIRALRLEREVNRKGLAADTPQLEYRDPKTPGLSLLLGRRSKSWSLTYEGPTGRRRTTLGRYPELSLADARREAEAKRVAARGGTDHQQLKRDHRAARTVEEVALEYLEKAARQHATHRTYSWVVRNDVIPAIGKMKIVDVRRRDLTRVIDRPLSAGKRYMANRVFHTLQGLFKWAKSRGEIEDNPTDGMVAPAKEKARDRTLTDDELAQLWAALPTVSFQVQAAIKLLVLTGQRLNEVVGAKWSEVDVEQALWTLPADAAGRSKKRKAAHLVPLSPPVLAILAELRKLNGDGATVFKSKGEGAGIVAPTRSMLSVPKMALDRALPEMPRWRIHDLRRTCRTGMGKLGVPQHVAELVIGHTLPGIIAVYDRYSYLAEKRDALNRWAVHVLQAVGEVPTMSAQVVPLRA
jgi:integrase